MIEFLFPMAFMLFIFLIWLLMIGVSVLALIFWVIMIIDVAKREFPKNDEKTLWVLIVVIGGAVGAIVYYFMIKKKDSEKVKKS